MGKALVDTCILSRFFARKGAEEPIKKWFVGNTSDLYISTITRYEIMRGLLKLPNGQALVLEMNNFIEANEITEVPVTAEISALAAMQSASTEAKGDKFAIDDLMIGATAVVINATIVTANVKHFSHWNQAILNPNATA